MAFPWNWGDITCLKKYLKKRAKSSTTKKVWPKTLRPVYYLSDLFVTFDAVGYDIRTKILHLLKGVWHEIFDLSFFFMNQCPPGPQVFHWGCFDFCCKISRRYSRINVYHRCQRHRRKAVQRCQRHRRKIYRLCCWHWLLFLVTDFQWSPVSLIPGINLSLTPVTNYRRWQRHRR